MKENFKYQDAEKLDWQDLRAANSEPAVMPFSVYMPLNMPYSEKFIQCAPTFCAYVLPVPPDLCAHSPFARPLRNSLKTTLVDFAFGNPPSVPDFRKTKMERVGGKYPQVRMSYYHFGLLYEFEYCVSADNTLWIRASVTNRKEIPLQAHFRARAGNYRELDIFNYFYYPFYWDITKYKVDHSIHFAEDCLIGPDGVFCKVHPGGFEFSREESFEFKDDDYNHCDNFENPGWIPPFLRLKSGGRNIHFSAELAPGEKKSCSLAVRTGKEWSPDCGFEEAANSGCAVFDSEKSAEIDFGDEEENNIFKALQWNTLQLLNESDSRFGHLLMPTQGGISERFFVWSWEVMHCFRPMITLGYFKQVRRVLEYLLSLQNRPECRPKGEYAALEGAIGDTANGWANCTGAVLLLASDYVRCSQDDNFIKKYKRQLDLAAKWLVEVISATRIPGAFNYGLFPKANSTDGDREICLYAFTDSWNCAGLSEYAKHVNPEFEREAVQYRRDLEAAISRNIFENGDIARALEGKAFHGFNIITGALNFLDAGNIGSDDSRLINYVKYLESRHFNGFFCSPMNDEVNYVGNSESIVFSHWLKRGEFKKAWTAWMTLRRFAMTRDLYLTQERCSIVDPSFTPWQPNASNNGRILKTMMGRLYLEDGNRVILFGGLAPFELEKRKRISIRGLHTEFGILDFHYSDGNLSLCWNKPVATDIKSVLPEYFADKIRISVSE